MLGEYKVSRCTRQCHAQRRPLREGEWYYSVVIESDEEYIRQDFSAESWKGPPEGAVGWWKNRMPTANEKKMVLAPPEVLVDLLRQMERFPARAKSRYLLALMLMRRKIVRPVDDVERSNLGAGLASDRRNESDDDPPRTSQVLRVKVLADESTIDVPICQINRSESDTLRDELNELLYCEAEQEQGLDSEGD